DEPWMTSNGASAHKVKTRFLSSFCCFSVEVVNDFHMITNESDGNNNQIFAATVRDTMYIINDIRFQPRLCGWSRTTLVRHVVICNPTRLGYQSSSFMQLLCILAIFSHRYWNAMSCVDNLAFFTLTSGNLY